MSTGLDLTDEFVLQFQKLHERCETLQRQLDERPATPSPPVPPQPAAPDPKLVDQIQQLTREVARLKTDLVEKQEALDQALARESKAREQNQPTVDTTSATRQEVERVTARAQRQIAELNAKIKQLEQQSTERETDDRQSEPGSMSFEQSFPAEAKELRKLNETVYLYRKKYGPII